MLVYKATNKINGKIYIGKTVRQLSHAKARHVQRARYAWKYGSQSRFYNAIRKHGEDAFEWEIVYQGTSDADIQAEEIRLIGALRSNDPKVGYNSTPGGDGGAGKVLSSEHIAKLSANYAGEKNPCFGLFGKDHPAYGHKKSDEVIERIRQAHLGKSKSVDHRRKLSDARKKLSRFSEADYQEIVSLRHAGLTYREIGEKLGCSTAVASKIYRRETSQTEVTPRRDFSESEQNMVVELREAGVPFREIAERLTCGIGVVSGIYRRLTGKVEGVGSALHRKNVSEARKRMSRFTDADYRAVVEMRNAGAAFSEIAVRLGCNYSVARNIYLRETGQKGKPMSAERRKAISEARRKKGQTLTEVDRRRVVEMRNVGDSFRAISVALKCTPSAARGIYRLEVELAGE